jgi:Fic family protein
MRWNWQKEDWPNFSWDAPRLQKAEALFLEGAGIAIGVSKHLGEADRGALSVELMSLEAIDTSAIEGEALDRDSVQSSIRRRLGFAGDQRRVKPAEAGIAEMMVDLYEHAGEPLHAVTFHRWHRLVTNGRTDLADLGCYRRGGDPMQIVSGPIHRPKIHFEAPPAAQVDREMDLFLAWIQQSGPDGPSRLTPLTRAGLAHIWFESIHPYEDGNGRIGRAISEKLLAQGLPTPVVTGMASTLLAHRKAYYAALERAHGTLEITDWLLWFAAKSIEAQRRTLQQVEFVLAKARVLGSLGSLGSKLNTRQERALLRMFAAGPDGFVGGLSAANYMTITGAPPATTTRDLAALVGLGALLRTGEHKSTRYRLNIAIEEVQPIDIADLD